MAESARGFVRVVERRQRTLSTVSVLIVEEYLEDGPSFCPVAPTILRQCLELADLVVDEDVQ